MADPVCKACKVRHNPRLSCKQARLIVEAATLARGQEVVETSPAMVETSGPVVETKPGRAADRHKDPAAHREKMREHMAKKRLFANGK